MSVEVDDFMAKRREYLDHEIVVKKLADALQKALQKINETLRHVQVSPGSDTLEALAADILADARPTAHQFSSALSQLYQLRHELVNAWRRIPYQQQQDYLDYKPDTEPWMNDRYKSN